MSDLTGPSLQQRNSIMTRKQGAVDPIQGCGQHDPGGQPVQIRYQRINHRDRPRPGRREKIEGNLCIEHLFDNLPDGRDKNYPLDPNPRKKYGSIRSYRPLKKKPREFR
jgi:hypothetical protein